ncbi:VWA domain-containing protein [Vogesella indigofera]|uniref:VWA domain-containing protein n=1 Tax=Vogesella indigofera TaxID=45465 RepID=UPI00234F4CAB|nr:VWA domain-containing protein [Vogesella indigofera]MDC7712395.1 VWA domain-containing protein [Vogesella indigofera]
MRQTAFDATSLSRRFDFLEACPEHLLSEVVTLPIGTLEERVNGVRAWQDALLLGHLPAVTCWPPASIGNPVRLALQSLGILRFTRGQPDLVDTLIKDILAVFAERQDSFQSKVMSRLRELEALEHQRLEADELARAKRKKHLPRAIILDPGCLLRLQIQAEGEQSAQLVSIDAGLYDLWSERVRAWASIADVFDDLGQMLGRGWDLTRGVLRHSGWLDLLRLRKLLEQLPRLREIIQALGRLHLSEDGESVSERVFVPMRRLAEEMRQIRTPHIPNEMRGVERSGEIARMLPAEATMLVHPQLRLLWHARRADRSLTTYRVEGVETERVGAEREVMKEIEQKCPRPQRGPIISVIDTSGSMHGTPEQVAKALVLEVLRTAHAEKRRCLALTFSGTGDMTEHELDLSPEGIGSFLNFLGISFDGGTDIGGAMERVVSRLKDNDWKKADVLLVSDGEWLAPERVISMVKDARNEGTRFHGILIGSANRHGFDTLCDHIHIFMDWEHAGGGQVR